MLFGDRANRQRCISRLIAQFVTAVKVIELEQFTDPLLRYRLKINPGPLKTLDALQDVVRQKVVLQPSVQQLEFKREIMIVQEYWGDLLTVYIAVFVAFTSPGPNFVAITSYSVQSRSLGYGVALGISIGTAIWALFAATGLTALLSTFELATTVISIVGGLYLIWLGYNAFKSVFSGQKFKPNSIATQNITSLAKSIAPGLTIQLTNPKTALFWLALTSLVIRPNTPSIVIFFLVTGCLILAIIWHCLLAFAFSTGPLREAYIKYKPVFSTIFGIIFVGYGLRVFYSILWG